MVKKVLTIILLVFLIYVGVSATLKSWNGPESKLPPAANQHEAWLADLGRFHTQLLELLDGVKDEATSQEAVPRLDALVNNLTMMESRRQMLSKPQPEEQARLREKYRPLLQRGQEQLATAVQRCRDLPKADPALLVSLTNMMTTLEKLPID